MDKRFVLCGTNFRSDLMKYKMEKRKISSHILEIRSTRKMPTNFIITTKNDNNMIELDKIYNEDCLIGMQRIPDGSVDAIICDLPYGTTANKWDSVIPFDKLWAEYKRIIKPKGAIVLFGSEPFSSTLRMSNPKWYKYDWIWEKEEGVGFQLAKVRPMMKTENISVFSAAGIGHANLLGNNRMTYNPQGTIAVHKTIKNAKGKFGGTVGARPSHKESYIAEAENYPRMTLDFDCDYDGLHPTQKPVDLLRYLILTYSNEGDTILDATIGSGTTAVAALMEKRHFIGFETNKEYFDIAQGRIDQVLRNPTLF